MKGWYGNRQQHSMASRGIKSRVKIPKNIVEKEADIIIYEYNVPSWRHDDYIKKLRNWYQIGEISETKLRDRLYEYESEFKSSGISRDGERELNWMDYEDIKYILENYGFAVHNSESEDDIRDALWDNIDDGTIPESVLSASGKTKFIMLRDLMRKEGIEDDNASPNFVKDFADNRGIKLSSEEVVDVSNRYTIDYSFDWRGMSYQERAKLVKESDLHPKVTIKELGVLTPNEISKMKSSFRMREIMEE